jgi:hypothetical protein
VAGAEAPALGIMGGERRGPEEVAARGVDGGPGEDGVGSRARMAAGRAGRWSGEDDDRAARWPGDGGGLQVGVRTGGGGGVLHAATGGR